MYWSALAAAFAAASSCALLALVFLCNMLLGWGMGHLVLTWSSSPFFWSFSQPFLPFPSSPQPLPRRPRRRLRFWAVYASDQLHWTSCALGGVKRHVGGRCGW